MMKYADLAAPVTLDPGTTYLAAVEVTVADFIYEAPVTWAGGINYGSGKATPVGSPAMPATANASTFVIDYPTGASYLGPNLKIVGEPTEPPVTTSTQAMTFNSVGSAGGAEFITGWEFNTAEPIRVTHLGHVDMQNNGIAASADVGIWSVSTGTLLGSVTVGPGSPSEASGAGSTLYEPIAPLDLLPGNYIVAAQSNGEGFYYNTPHTTAPGIAWVAGKAAPLGPLPGSTAAFGITRADTGSYFGANFKFEPVPEPSTFVLAVLGAASVLVFRRRRNRQA